MPERLRLPALLVCLLLSGGAIGAAQESDELTALRELVETLRADYERRIAALEARLAAVDGGLREEVIRAPTSAWRARDRIAANNAFNPLTSLILDGNYYYDRANGRGAALAENVLQPSRRSHGDHEHDHEGANDNGFNLRETELTFSATVDPYFDASAFLAVDEDGSVDLEEAWFLTRGLPGGLQIKGGKFLSDFGYINAQHPHQWDFVDQNLPYLNLVGDHGLRDVGLQLSWLPELPWYTRFGLELLDGDQERVGQLIGDDEERAALGLDDEDNGPRLLTSYLELAPDLGYSHALQLGVSWVHAFQHQEIFEQDPETSGLEGDADLWGLEAVYKYDHAADYGFRDLTLQGEYLYARKDLNVAGGSALGSNIELATDGYYLQGVLGVAPRWQAGLRYDVVGLTNELTGGPNARFGDSRRLSAVLSWLPSEFSLLRLQWSHSDLLTADEEHETFDAVYLQYLLSLGTHGAHRF